MPWIRGPFKDGVYHMSENPMLTFSGFPKWSALNPEWIVPTLESLLERNRNILDRLVMLPIYHWENFVEPVSKIQNELHQVWSLVVHLHAVSESESIRTAYMAALPKITRYWSEFGQNQKIHQAYQSIVNSLQYVAFSKEQKKVIDNALRDFRLSGVALPPEKRNLFLQLQDKLAELSSIFGNHVLDATHAWGYFTENEAELSGLPDWAKQAAAQAASNKNKTGWLITLDQPLYHAVMTYCDNRALREAIYRAHTTRASDQDGGQWDNSSILDEIISARHQLAQLLGYAQYSEYSLATKMAPSPAAVLDFLFQLIEKSRAKALGEYEELKIFANQYGDIRLEVWDIAYWSEKQAEQKFSISAEKLRLYFPISRVLSGLFEIARRLYGIRVTELKGIDVWDPAVQVFEVTDEAGGALRGHLYLDLYARPSKRDGAWMDEYRTRARFYDTELQHPMVYLVCNFAPPTLHLPALLTHEEVLTLFHEFGHGLHHILTHIDHPAISGTFGVPWDAVELPSQFFEHWAWESESLQLISCHIETGESLPEASIQHLKAAKNFHSGLQTLRQLEFSLFDFQIHHTYAPDTDGKNFVVKTLEQVRKEVAVIIPPAYNRFAHSFAHIFAGGYAAGYYSYKWAEVLACDAFSLFKEKGIFNAELGQFFLQTLLGQGGLFDSLDAFIQFRGREPDIHALLQYYGMD